MSDGVIWQYGMSIIGPILAFAICTNNSVELMSTFLPSPMKSEGTSHVM